MVRMKIAVLISDSETLGRFVRPLSANFDAGLEIYAFTDRTMAMNSLIEDGINLFLTESDSGINTDDIPKMCTLVYLSELDTVKEIRGVKTICLYYRPDTIYKELMGIFAESSNMTVGSIGGKGSAADVYTFLSPIGGVGSSTIAAAFAVYLTQYQRRVLYLNFEKNGDASAFFKGDGTSDMSDIFYDIKSKKPNLAIRIESKVEQDESGVFFVQSCRNALDMVYISDKDISEFIKTISDLKLFDDIIIDTDCSMDDRMLETIRVSNNTIIVNDGKSMSNAKIDRFFASMSALENEKEEAFIAKIYMFMNKYDAERNSYDEKYKNIVLGGIDNYYDETPRQIIQRALKTDVFDYYYYSKERFSFR